MRRLFMFVAALAAISLPARAQDDAHYGESVSVGYVMVPFTVVGAKGAPVATLREKDLRLEVDGVKVAHDLFEKSVKAPVSFTILLDTSGSMGLAGKMDAARSALNTLFEHRVDGDDYALYTFADAEIHKVVPFTRDPGPIAYAMRSIHPFGKTAFFDAIARMPEESELGHNPTRAIILLSDGIDNASKLSLEELSRRLQGVPVPVYPLGLREPGEALEAGKESGNDLVLLQQVAQMTGGQLFVGNQPQELAKAVDRLDSLLRTQYLLGFTPTGRGAVKYRHITLKLAGSIDSVRVRAGYVGTEPPVAVASSKKSKRNERKRT